MYTGGYPFYHPIELMCIRWGTLTALLGIVAAAMGRKGRIPLAIISVLNLVLWFAAGMAQ
jgi:Zn-dependent protease with chaperone function